MDYSFEFPSFRTAILLIFLTNAVNRIRADCIDDFTPCFCSEDSVSGSVNVICYGIPFQEIKNAFSTTPNGPRDINRLDIVPAAGEDQMPADLIGNSRVRILNLASCPLPIQIDSNSFQSSIDYTQQLFIIDCDIGQLTWTFISGFLKLEQIQLDNVANIQSIEFLPSLRTLKLLSIVNSEGFDQLATRFPVSSFSELQSLRMTDNIELTDLIIDTIVSQLVVIETLQSLSLNNNPSISRIPNGLPLLPGLNSIDLSGCEGINSIGTDSFGFFVPSLLVDVSAASVDSVSNDAFENGYYGNARILLDDNSITEFRSTVYLKPLEEMSTSTDVPGSISIEKNPIRCDDCLIAWLIRDRREFFQFVSGTCDNGTRFQDLNPSWYDDALCAVLTTTTTTTTSSVMSSTEDDTTLESEMTTTEISTETENGETSSTTTTTTKATVQTPDQTTTPGQTSTPQGNNRTEAPNSNDNNNTKDYDNLFYILYGVLGAIGLILIFGFFFLGYTARKLKKSARPAASGIVKEYKSVPAPSYNRSNDSSSVSNGRSSLPTFDSRPPVILDVNQLQMGSIPRPAAPITTPYISINPYSNGSSTTPGRVRGLRRVNF